MKYINILNMIQTFTRLQKFVFYVVFYVLSAEMFNQKLHKKKHQGCVKPCDFPGICSSAKNVNK